MCDRGNFLIEEFKANWEYIRHIENLRLKHLHLYLILAGSVFTLLIKDIDKQKTIYVLFGTLFIFIYGFILARFMVYQKNGYDRYAVILANIRRDMSNNYQIDDLGLITRFNSNDKAGGPFYWWYWLVAMISISALSLLALYLYINETNEFNLMWTAIMFMLAIYCGMYIDIKSNANE